MLACAWIVVSLAGVERALGAPQSGGAEKQDTRETEPRVNAGTDQTKGSR